MERITLKNAQALAARHGVDAESILCKTDRGGWEKSSLRKQPDGARILLSWGHIADAVSGIWFSAATPAWSYAAHLFRSCSYVMQRRGRTIANCQEVDVGSPGRYGQRGFRSVHSPNDRAVT